MCVILREQKEEMDYLLFRVDRPIGAKQFKLECHVKSAGVSMGSRADRSPPGEDLRISPLFFRKAKITDSVNQIASNVGAHIAASYDIR